MPKLTIAVAAAIGIVTIALLFPNQVLKTTLLIDQASPVRMPGEARPITRAVLCCGVCWLGFAYYPSILRESPTRSDMLSATALLLSLLGFAASLDPASAQDAPATLLHFTPRPPSPNQALPIAAVRNVQINYGDATVEANQVVYDQKTKRLMAEGNVGLTEPDGKITYGQKIDLSDGLVDSLRLERRALRRNAPIARRATTRSYTSAYTACEACEDGSKKSPLGQMQAAPIIQGEKMLYEDG